MINNDKKNEEVQNLQNKEDKLENTNENEIYKIMDLLTMDEVISYISNDLVFILIENRGKAKVKVDDVDDPLYSNRVPIIKIEDYLKRLVQYSKMEISTLILTFIYIKRFIDKENFIILFNNIFRLIISCSILAIKFNENRTFKNTIYAKIGGLSVEELNNLEYNVFNRLNFQLHVTDKEFSNIIFLIYKEYSQNN